MTSRSHEPTSRQRTRSPSSSRSPSGRPSKRRRRNWAVIVEELALANGVEDSEHRIAQRQKQVDYGKNTLAYDKFIAVLPRHKRQKGDPMTPIPRQKCSKRSFAGQVTSWKKRVYEFVAALEEVRDESKKDGRLEGDEIEKKAEEKELETDGKDAEEEATVESAVKKQCGEDAKDIVTTEPSDTLGEADEEDDFSDMEDIQLDDFGNVVSNETSPPPTDRTGKDKPKLEESPPSIFDVY